MGNRVRRSTHGTSVPDELITRRRGRLCATFLASIVHPENDKLNTECPKRVYIPIKR